MFEMLLNTRGVNFNAQCEDGNTVLMQSVISCNSSVFKLLMECYEKEEHSLNVNTVNSLGQTAKDIAK